ncbi:MAG: endonuclease/exonuclease/phosphatase family protein [Gammaproteobacteria bacterium]|nr:endonuclease/exonuclease/phosphatase family protein [Gammaproteobacteria bacterium]
MRASTGAAFDQPLRLLTFNIQVGIQTRRYHQYVTSGWKHVLPHESRTANLNRIAEVISNYDLVALQEVDGGSLRSGFVNQVEYLAHRAQFRYWYAQLNRDLGPFAQHGNGFLSRVEPQALEDHKLPGVIPGRGAIVVRVPFAGSVLLVILLHLSLGERSRQRQLCYVRDLIEGHKNVIVMGDMNSHLSKLLHSSPLAQSELRPADRVEPTYPSWRPAVALDHVLVSRSLEISNYEVLPCRLSDHLPIAVTVEAHDPASAGRDARLQ